MKRLVPEGMTIQCKLVGLIVTSLTAMVCFLTVHFSARQIDGLRETLGTRARSYGALLSGEVRSAVAFSDQATAREVLSSIEADADVASVSLFDGTGRTLYERGRASAWVEQARRGVVSTQSVSRDGRVAVVVPVQSLEGPRGTLVLELSTARLLAAQQQTTRTSVAAGVAALFFGVIVAWLISRSLSRRLRAIASVATAVSAGDLGQATVRDASSDEIGVLANAFDHMLGQLREEKVRLEQSVRELRSAEEALAAANHELEARVTTRTAELSNANAQLRIEMDQRSQMELELRQAQKLESVGRLAAGIAHEINTPVQFVSDSTQFLLDATHDVHRVVELYRRALNDVSEGKSEPGHALAEVATVEDEVDLAYLIEQMPLAVRRSMEGLQRVAGIVRAMKEFAYPEQKEKTLADLNKAIETTLMVSKNEYKYVAEVRTELGEIPKVLCHVGELNQAILAMVVNAAHAIEDVVRESGEKGEIIVRTWSEGEHVGVSIRDTGKGIPANIIEKIFDPFFTTKPVGKGTGQGLAIARSIVVDKHGGKLTVASEVGQGTTMTVLLPQADVSVV